MSESQNGESPRPATERAEEVLDELGRRIGRYVAAAAPRIRRLVALAREEAEDIWAEAQHLRTQSRHKAK